MPYESTRVCLQPIRGVEGSDYINASFIDGYRWGLWQSQRGFKSQHRILFHRGFYTFPQATESLHCHAGTTGRDHGGLLEDALGAQLHHRRYAHQAQRNGEGMQTECSNLNLALYNRFRHISIGRCGVIWSCTSFHSCRKNATSTGQQRGRPGTSTLWWTPWPNITCPSTSWENSKWPTPG